MHFLYIQPGTRVKHNRTGFIGTVVPNGERPGLGEDSEYILVLPDKASDLPYITSDGLWPCLPMDVSVLPGATWKVGDIVRANDGTTGVATHINDTWTTITHGDDRDEDYRHEDVAPLYPLTRKELTAIEAGLRRGDLAGVDAALAVTDKYLHPTVTDTYTVTVERPAGFRPDWYTPEGLAAPLRAQLGSNAKITIKETD